MGTGETEGCGDGTGDGTAVGTAAGASHVTMQLPTEDASKA